MLLRMKASQLRVIQTQLDLVTTKRQETLRRAEEVVKAGIEDEITFSRWTKVSGRLDSRALLFQRTSDPLFYACLIANESLRPSEVLSLCFPFEFRLPLIVGLICFNEPRARIAKYSFLFDSASLQLGTYHVGYAPAGDIKRDVRRLAVDIFNHELAGRLQWDKSAALLNWLNAPVSDLPYRPGDKQRLVQSLIERKIDRIGDLAQKTEAELSEFLSSSDVNKIKALLIGIDLALGIPLPGWNKRIQKSSV